MLSKPQEESVWDLVLGRISEETFVVTFGIDPRTNDEYLPELLAEAVRRHDAGTAEAALTLVFRFDLIGLRYLAVLCDLLVADWHHQHEDVARALQQLADPAAVPALRHAAELDLPYREYDEARALSRKCMWALSDIRTESAVAALESLSHSSNATIRELAAHHLAKIRRGEPPSPASRRLRGR